MTKRLSVIGGMLSLIALATIVLVAGSATSDHEHWPQWRGPFFNGVAKGSAPPVEFSDMKNIKWKTAIPGRGFSTPVIWGDRIFLTTAVPTGKITKIPLSEDIGDGGGVGRGEEHKFVVMCLDKNAGKTLWERVAKVATPHEGYQREYGSFASNSPATDGRYLYASFGSRGIYCYDLDGKLIWEKDLGVRMKIRVQLGEAASPALHGNLLIHPFDQQGGSFVVALDKRNGKEVWRVGRDEESSWSTPLIADFKGKKQVVISATKKVRAYDSEDGKLIWECAGLGSDVVPHPAQQNDFVLVMSGEPTSNISKLMAIRLGREGDLTGSDAILWTQTRGIPSTTSPVLHDNKFYALTDNGMLSCLNATTGKPYYHRRRLPEPDNFIASPVAAGGNLYLVSVSGVVTVIKLGEKFEVLATNTLGDHLFVASPAVAEGEMFLRGKTHLFCVSDGKTE